MNFIMIGLLLREALDRLRVRLSMYLVLCIFILHEIAMLIACSPQLALPENNISVDSFCASCIVYVAP